MAHCNLAYDHTAGVTLGREWRGRPRGGERARMMPSAMAGATIPHWPSSLPDNTLQVTLPPLRERGEDVMVLLDRFAKDALGHAGGRRAFGREVLTAVRAYSWPGNISELKGAVVRLAAICKHGSVRAAGEALGMSKSALTEWLYRRNIPTPPK